MSFCEAAHSGLSGIYSEVELPGPWNMPNIFLKGLNQFTHLVYESSDHSIFLETFPIFIILAILVGM